MLSIFELQFKATNKLKDAGAEELDAFMCMEIFTDMIMNASDCKQAQRAACVLMHVGIVAEYSTTNFILDPAQGIGVVIIKLTLTEFGHEIADLLYGVDQLPPFDEETGKGVSRSQFEAGYEMHVNLDEEDDDEENDDDVDTDEDFED